MELQKKHKVVERGKGTIGEKYKRTIALISKNHHIKQPTYTEHRLVSLGYSIMKGYTRR